MAREEYELKEIRPGRFAKLVNGEVVGMASELDLVIDAYREHEGNDTSPSIIEVSLTVTSLAAVLANLEGMPLWFTLGAFVAFTLSGLAAFLALEQRSCRSRANCE